MSQFIALPIINDIESLTKQGEVIFHEEKINYLCLLTFEDDKNANTFIFPYINSVVHLTWGVL